MLKLNNWEGALEYGRRKYWQGYRHALLSLAVALLLFFAAGYSVASAEMLSLSNIYIDGALIHSNYGEARLETVTRYETKSPAPGWIVTSPIRYAILDESAKNPYARIAIGYDVQWSAQWSTRIDYSHESSISTGLDHGAERLTLGVTWRPFGGAR
jgi:hypothetical protein